MWTTAYRLRKDAVRRGVRYGGPPGDAARAPRSDSRGARPHRRRTHERATSAPGSPTAGAPVCGVHWRNTDSCADYRTHDRTNSCTYHSTHYRTDCLHRSVGGTLGVDGSVSGALGVNCTLGAGFAV